MTSRDNRHYDWADEQYSMRPEYPSICSWIPKGSSVIDLGCGNGSLLDLLRKEKEIRPFGIDISESGVELCKKKKIDAVAGRMDVHLDGINDNQFDFAICNVTLQMIMYPEITLQEMKRIARYQVVSFPNFAFLPNRLELLFMGRMPRKCFGGYRWYNTGSIHQLSIKDFKELAFELGFSIKDSVYLFRRARTIKIFPNLLASVAIFLMEKKR